MVTNIALYFKPSFATHILAFALTLSLSQAAEIENKESSIAHGRRKGFCNLTITINPNDNPIKGLEDIKVYTEKLLADGVSPESILLTLDVDGVITNFSNPKESPNLKSIGARGESVPFIKNMLKEGVNIVITSAWPFFEETLDRLRNLDIEEVLQISNVKSYTQNNEQTLFDTIKTKSCHLGLVASIGNFGTSLYYHQKSFAYKLVYPDLNEHTITHVISGDDNDQAVRDFERDFNILKKEKGLFSLAKLKLFTLSYARGESYLK